MSIKRTLDKAEKALDEYRVRIKGSSIEDIINKCKTIVQNKTGVSSLSGKYTRGPVVDSYIFSKRGKSVAIVTFSHDNFSQPDYKNEGGMLVVY